MDKPEWKQKIKKTAIKLEITAGTLFITDSICAGRRQVVAIDKMDIPDLVAALVTGYMAKNYMRYYTPEKIYIENKFKDGGGCWEIEQECAKCENYETWGESKEDDGTVTETVTCNAEQDPFDMIVKSLRPIKCPFFRSIKKRKTK